MTTLVATGSFSGEEMRGAVDSLYRDGTPPSLVLWDISGWDLTDADSGELRALVEYAIRLRGSREGKTAVVTDSNLQFGVGRMVSAWAEISEANVEVRVFRERRQAHEWLTAIDSDPG